MLGKFGKAERKVSYSAGWGRQRDWDMLMLMNPKSDQLSNDIGYLAHRHDGILPMLEIIYYHVIIMYIFIRESRLRTKNSK